MDSNSERSRSGSQRDCGQNAICVPHVHSDSGMESQNRPALARPGRARFAVAKTLSLLSNCIQGTHNVTALFGGTKL